MSKGKPRYNNENQLSKPCNQEKYHRYDWSRKDGKIYCNCYDGTYTNEDGTVHTILEMPDPWCDPDGPDGCKCNPYHCIMMKNKWFASLPLYKQQKIENGEATYYSNEITMSPQIRKEHIKH